MASFHGDDLGRKQLEGFERGIINPNKLTEQKTHESISHGYILLRKKRKRKNQVLCLYYVPFLLLFGGLAGGVTALGLGGGSGLDDIGAGDGAAEPEPSKTTMASPT